jgi:hypothetical protein
MFRKIRVQDLTESAGHEEYCPAASTSWTTRRFLMKRFEMFAALLALVLVPTYATNARDEHDSPSAEPTEGISDAEWTGSDYFAANWILFTNPDTKHTENDTIAANVGYDYLDANWKVFNATDDTIAVSAESLNNIASDYFDANWRINQVDSTPAGASVGAADSKSIHIANDYLDANWKAFGAPNDTSAGPGVTPENIANDYFDANWRIDKEYSSLTVTDYGPADAKLAGIPSMSSWMTPTEKISESVKMAFFPMPWVQFCGRPGG